MPQAQLALFIFAWFLTVPLLHADEGKHGNETPLYGKVVRAQITPPGTPGDKILKEGKFPTFHPLITHFPIVLIIAAIPFYAWGAARRRIVFRRSGMILAAFGFLGALLAGYVFHPHTEGLSPAAQEALSNHNFYATMTLYLTAIAIGIGVLTCMQRFQGLSLQATASIFLLLSALAVSITGHYGATLVHIYGVGPKGDFLSKEHIGIHIPIFDITLR
jgi:uncharacterized membrane protein